MIFRDIFIQAVSILGILASTTARCEPMCVSGVDAIETASHLWRAGETQREAVEVLKAARGCQPEDREVARALGTAYARMGNYPWALRVLNGLNAEGDCASAAWSAWIYLQMALPEEAERVLEHVSCEDEALKGRLELVRAFISMTSGDRDRAIVRLERVSVVERLTESDAESFDILATKMGTRGEPNLTIKMALSFGYASNALSGSPNDPALLDREMDSALMDGEIRIMLDPWKRSFVRAIFEGQVTGQYLISEDAEDSSYLDISMRPGIVADFEHLRFGAYYRPEFLIMFGSDKYASSPIHFYTAHRVELDFEIYRWLYLFAGVGHRTFRQAVRTRDEFDFGAGGQHGLGSGFSLVWGATYRQWFSKGDMYDLWGLQLSLSLDYRIPRVRMLLRLNGSFSYDDYPDSLGYFDATSIRRDKALRGVLHVWSPSWGGFQVGAQFKASRRWSSAASYEYEDYRVLLSLRWNGNWHFYDPKTVLDDVWSLPWNLESEGATERIRDMIRQDEDMQRSSSCLQN